MTDQATAPAATAGTDASASAATATNGSPAATAPDIFASLQDAESRQWVESKGYKALDPLIASARHADKLQTEITDLKSKALTPPGTDAKPEDWDAFYAKIGRPEAADKYEFAMPQDLPKDLPYDGEMAKSFKQAAFAAGLTARQAQALHDWSASQAAQGMTAQTEAATARSANAHKALTEAWGAAESEGYKTNLRYADRFIANNGGENLLAEMRGNGLLAPGGQVLSPVLAQALAKAGKALYAEDSLVSGNPVSAPKDAASTLYPKDPFAV